MVLHESLLPLEADALLLLEPAEEDEAGMEVLAVAVAAEERLDPTGVQLLVAHLLGHLGTQQDH